MLYGIYVSPNLKVLNNIQFAFYYTMMIILAILYVKIKFTIISKSLALGVIII